MLDPQSVPDPRALADRAMALAMLDAIICPEFTYRYFNFDGAWGDDEQMASMHNGDGAHWFLHMGRHGAAIKGYVRQFPRGATGAMAQRVQRTLPAEFNGFLREPSFEMDAVTFCYWQGRGDAGWNKVAHPDAGQANWSDGSADYLSILLAPPACYGDYAADYFDCAVPLSSIEHIYALAPLSAAIVNSLNPQLTLEEALASAATIGYPRVAARDSLTCRVSAG